MLTVTSVRRESMIGADQADRMRKVVDTNFLQSEELRAYLSEPSNFAVVTDYVVMEVLQGDSPAKIYDSMEILTGYPKQVIALKSVSAACILKTRR